MVVVVEAFATQAVPAEESSKPVRQRKVQSPESALQYLLALAGGVLVQSEVTEQVEVAAGAVVVVVREVVVLQKSEKKRVSREMGV